MSIIDVEKLTKRYGARVGVVDVDLKVPEGAIYGFIGPNGAGKTTTIRVMLGFLRPTSGASRIFGRDCWRESHVIKRDVGYLAGDVRLYPWLNARRALELVSRVRGQDVRPVGRVLLERFGLEPDVTVRRMSRGMRQKLGLLIALAPDPRLFVLDEPTSGLDPIMQGRLAEHLRERARAGHTVFFSSHTLREVEDLCSRVAIVRDGRIVADEAIETLRRRAKRHVVIRFHERNGFDPAGAIAPSCLAVERRAGDVWHGTLVGDVDQLVAWLGQQPVADLEISPPDLEQLFHRYYEDGDAS